MSTREDRAHDAWVDAHTVHPDCGQTLDRCDCTEHEPMPDPDTLDHADATCWAATCRAVARAIRHELPYATAERIAEDLDQRAGSYQDRADGTPDPTPRDTLIDTIARVIHDADHPDGCDCDARGIGGPWAEDVEGILSSPEARAAVIAATPRDELLAALVADGTFTEEMPDHSGYGGGLNPALLGKRRLVTRWEPTP